MGRGLSRAGKSRFFRGFPLLDLAGKYFTKNFFFAPVFRVFQNQFLTNWEFRPFLTA